ncbi:hypothetical protein COOONC_15004 [Cooperia oncophora]
MAFQDKLEMMTAIDYNDNAAQMDVIPEPPPPPDWTYSKDKKKRKKRPHVFSRIVDDEVQRMPAEWFSRSAHKVSALHTAFEGGEEDKKPRAEHVIF